VANGVGKLSGTSTGGLSGDHPTFEGNEARVAPATGAEKNVVATLLVPLGCWRVEDMRFAFDSSFVLPGVKDELVLLAKLREKHTLRAPGATPGAETLVPPPLSLFGHADPVGNDDYNKTLSGRRATAIYGMLTRDTALWENLFSHPAGGDNWGRPALQTMLTTTDPTLTSDAARLDQQTTDAQGNAGTRSALFLSYMNRVSSSIKLAKGDFLAGTDAKGKADYQGCGEFNPMLIFSQQEAQEFQDPANKDSRNSENAPNRRVIGLLFRPGTTVDPNKWPCPRADEGVAGCRKRFWSDGESRRSRRLPADRREFAKTQDTFACRFYHRLMTGSPCEKTVPLVPAVLEIILDNNNNFAVDGAEPVATFVRLGIWDHGWDPATGNLINTAADAQNFIGKDSTGPQARRFYLRVKDPNASGQAEVRVDWRTEFGNGTADDAPASQVISLLPLASDPTLFVSHALFLVSDTVDQAQATDSGLPAGNADRGSRTLGQSNHRIRKILVDDTHRLDSQIKAEYTPVLGGATVTATVPVFQRSPEERLKIKVHLVNVRNRAGGTGVLTAARKTSAIDTLRSVYARCGIFLEIDEIVIDPPASCINWQTRYPASPLAIAADPALESAAFPSGNLAPSASQTDVINLIRARADFDANDIYIVYVTKIWSNPIPAPSPTAILAVGPGGISFPDSFTAAGSIARSFVFVGVQTVNSLADPHEMTHVTTNLRNSAGGHFHLEATVNAGPGNIDGRNLMQRFALIGAGNTADSKRLWDENFTNNNITPATIPAQITAIRASRFVRPI